MNKSASIAEPGELQLHLVLANLVGWVVVLLVLSKGIQSLGKVSLENREERKEIK